MPAYASDSCGKDKNALCRVFFDGAGFYAHRATPLPDWAEAGADVLARMGQLLSGLQENRKGPHTVWASSVDPYPGTLEQKLEAGTGITLTAQAPSGTTGKAASERIMRISAAGTTSSPKDASYANEHSEAARSSEITAWDRSSQGANDGYKFSFVTGSAYYHGGDETWYEHRQDATVDSNGQFTLFGAEYRVTVDAPGACAADTITTSEALGSMVMG